jgi:hypothetical protein
MRVERLRRSHIGPGPFEHRANLPRAVDDQPTPDDSVVEFERHALVRSGFAVGCDSRGLVERQLALVRLCGELEHCLIPKSRESALGFALSLHVAGETWRTLAMQIPEEDLAHDQSHFGRSSEIIRKHCHGVSPGGELGSLPSKHA